MDNHKEFVNTRFNQMRDKLASLFGFHPTLRGEIELKNWEVPMVLADFRHHTKENGRARFTYIWENKRVKVYLMCNISNDVPKLSAMVFDREYEQFTQSGMDIEATAGDYCLLLINQEYLKIMERK